MFMCGELLATQRDLPSAWTDWLMYCSILGYLSIAIAEFIAALGLIPGGGHLDSSRFLFLVSIVALQWLGIRVSSLFQEVTTSLKCIAFLVLVAACLLVPSGWSPSARIAAIDDVQRVRLSRLQAIVITYGGWQSPLYFIEEDRGPRAQSSANYDRRCAVGDRDLPAC